jgi:hypothetical protein
MAQGSNFPRSRARFGKSGATACQQSAAYAMGLIAAQDCELGLTLSHGGGYPGYGSHMLLLPDHNIGVFVFSNRTYNGGSGAAWDAAVALHRAGALLGRSIPVSPSLAAAYRAAGAVYQAGQVRAAGNLLAMNFLMDRSAANWARELSSPEGGSGRLQHWRSDHRHRGAGGQFPLALRAWPHRRHAPSCADRPRRDPGASPQRRCAVNRLHRPVRQRLVVTSSGRSSAGSGHR